VPTLEEVREQIGHIDGGSRFLARKEIKELPSILWEDEHVERLVQGTYSGAGTGVLVATNKRLVFVDKGIGKLKVEDFPYDKVTSIQYKTGWTMGEIVIFSPGNKAEIKNVAKDQCKNFADNVRARITGATAHASHSQPVGEHSGAGVDVIDQLERLTALREKGTLSDAEFEAQKQRILGN
jgi:Bacterial PH domain/Short C-terminal domain